MMISIVLAMLMGCSDDGMGEVNTSADAPWDMNGAAAFLFTPNPENNGRVGSGTLSISTDSGHDCASVRGGPPTGASGLLFTLTYFTGRSAGSASPAWDGLYAAGTATSTTTEAYRSLAVGGWHKGFEYAFEDSDAWIDVSDGSKDKFVGSFSTEWWDGTFRAKMCEGSDDIDSVDGEDTGAL